MSHSYVNTSIWHDTLAMVHWTTYIYLLSPLSGHSGWSKW